MTYVVGYLPGVFDLLHLGHLRVIERASCAVDVLVVGVCSDRCVRRSKGRRPVVGQWERWAMVRACRWVAEAVIYDDVDQSELLRALTPSVFFHGPEYGRTAKQQKTLAACRTLGVKVLQLSRTAGVSTTERRSARL